MMRDNVKGLLIIVALALTILSIWVLPASAQTCPADFCENTIDSLCDPGGFKVTLKSFSPAAPADSGTATYVYEICSPAAGTCSFGASTTTKSCLDHQACELNCTGGGKCAGTDIECTTEADCVGTCDRECVVDEFRGLSHFDIALPQLDGLSCLGENTQFTLTCGNGTPVVGPDGSCGGVFVAKCDETNLASGSCFDMTIEIAGELNGLGPGAAIVVSKESTDCNESCISGPSCDPCDDGPGDDGKECLTRTRGFWGTHPHIADDYLPVTVCGQVITGTAAYTCSTSEALCTSASDNKKNPDYLTLVAQLTAAKLNLEATADLVEGATCSGFTFDEKSIQEIIAYCEGFCGASKQEISNSGCIEALDAFNNSDDTGFDQTPAPFDRPGPAQPTQCQAARGNGKAIGVNLSCPPAQ